MIVNLMMKDLKVYWKKIFLRLMVPYMLLGMFFIFKYFPWNVYMMIGYLNISIGIMLYHFGEKANTVEILNCSLPVSRSDIVWARYLTSTVIVTVCLVLWYINGTIADQIIVEPMTDWSRATHLKVVFIALFYFSVLVSVFLPSGFNFRILGMILTFVVALVSAVTSLPLLFRTYSYSFRPQFVAADVPKFMLLGLVMLLIVCISFFVSQRTYKHKDV